MHAPLAGFRYVPTLRIEVPERPAPISNFSARRLGHRNLRGWKSNTRRNVPDDCGMKNEERAFRASAHRNSIRTYFVYRPGWIANTEFDSLHSNLEALSVELNGKRQKREKRTQMKCITSRMHTSCTRSPEFDTHLHCVSMSISKECEYFMKNPGRDE